MWTQVCKVALFVALVSSGTISEAASLKTLGAVHALTNAQAESNPLVDFEATVTYFRPRERTLFVQDGQAAIYVQTQPNDNAVPGDRVRITGKAHKSFRPFVMGESLTVLRHGEPLQPVRASFDDLIHARMDCRLVTIRGRVLSADIAVGDYSRGTTMQILTDGGIITATVDSDNAEVLPGLLDAEVLMTGAESGRFDGKMQMTGVEIHAQNLGYLQVLQRSKETPWSLPLTPMDEILSGFQLNGPERRLHVRGAITYYQPGLAVVLQDGEKSLWISTRTRADLKIGDLADATGYTDVHDGFLKLALGEVQDSQQLAPVKPIPVKADTLIHSHHPFDLVSIEATVVEQVREGGQDVYVLAAGGHLFSAVARHAGQSTSEAAVEPMKQFPAGSKVRVTGVCIMEDSNPFESDVPFDLLLRSFNDIQLIERPSWVSVRNLARLVSVLLLIVLVVSIWGWTLRLKVNRQTAALAKRVEAEAAAERRNAQIEQRRSRILEDITGSRPLAEVLEEITALVSFNLNGAPCWCEIVDGARLGSICREDAGFRIIREPIPGRSGPALGILFAAVEGKAASTPAETSALLLGSRLATLAIETRRMYSDLVRRSEFDLLTDTQNRFSLDKQLDALIAQAKKNAGLFGLIYVDLDEFKQVNDRYGHQTGDHYLQAVAHRMKRQLRSRDVLARLGGDEFAALVPAARNRAEVEEIAARLELCFNEPFELDGHVMRGSASVGIALYPENGLGKDSLLTAADSAMYSVKHARRASGEEMHAGKPSIPEPSNGRVS